jgi:hypothetical protein
MSLKENLSTSCRFDGDYSRIDNERCFLNGTERFFTYNLFSNSEVG